MEYLIAVFKSRNQTIKVSERLKKMGVYCEVINTPRQASLGCGLSVKFYPSALPAVRRLINNDCFYSFGGVFKVCGRSVTPL